MIDIWTKREAHFLPYFDLRYAFILAMLDLFKFGVATFEALCPGVATFGSLLPPTLETDYLLFFPLMMALEACFTPLLPAGVAFDAFLALDPPEILT